MSKKPKVTVLVPIYNVEKYLKQCVDSVINQTLKEIEIILLDDGSTDNCPKICDEYAQKDKRVKVIHKPNSGYGATMNMGLKSATGDFIGIVESDDYVDANMFEELYNLAIQNKVDVVKSNFIRHTEKNGDEKINFLPWDDTEKVINPKKNSDIFYCQPSIWSAIYKRQFLEKYKIDFLESAGASFQDTGFNFKVWIQAHKVYLTQKAYLHYRCDNENSSVKSKSKVFCIVEEWKNIDKYLEDYPELAKKSYMIRNHAKLGGYLWNINRLEDEQAEAFRQVFAQEYTDILHHNGLKKDLYDYKSWHLLMKVIYPKSLKHKLIYGLQKISRLFFKTKIKHGKRYWKIPILCIKFKTKKVSNPFYGEGK